MADFLNLHYNGDQYIKVDLAAGNKRVVQFLLSLGFRHVVDRASGVKLDTQFVCIVADGQDIDQVAAIVRLGVPFITGAVLEEGFSA